MMTNQTDLSMPTQLILSREQRLEALAQTHWDIIIIGGGITGAGIFHQASQLGLKALLLEQKDFAWGSSSRSSKMVHGGLRYIAQGHFKLTKTAVQERQALIQQAPGLVTPHSFAMSHYHALFPGPFIFNLLLTLYDVFAGLKQHHYWPKHDYALLVPGLKSQGSLGGSQFMDAITDDARLVLRLIQEGQALGGLAINYIKVDELCCHNGQVNGVKASTRDQPNDTNTSYEIQANALVNATGAWCEDLLNQLTAKHVTLNLKKKLAIRPLRGSHLIVPSWRLPVASAICILHPHDQRPVQVFPWQNMTLIGTTDVEHKTDLSQEPSISQAEYEYLLAAVQHQFPQANLNEQDIVSTFSGVRPIVEKQGFLNQLGQGTRKKAPSKENRNHSVLHLPGFVTVAGGKLTTFRVIAIEVLTQLIKELQLSQEQCHQLRAQSQCFEPLSPHSTQTKPPLPEQTYQRLQGQYGALTPIFMTQILMKQYFTIHTKDDLTQPFAYSSYIAGELAWALRYEQVMHLDDLLLRRTRLGNVLPQGGMGHMDRVKRLCQSRLNWDDARWQAEVTRYQDIWSNYYRLPSQRRQDSTDN